MFSCGVSISCEQAASARGSMVMWFSAISGALSSGRVTSLKPTGGAWSHGCSEKPRPALATSSGGWRAWTSATARSISSSGQSPVTGRNPCARAQPSVSSAPLAQRPSAAGRGGVGSDVAEPLLHLGLGQDGAVDVGGVELDRLPPQLRLRVGVSERVAHHYVHQCA